MASSLLGKINGRQVSSVTIQGPDGTTLEALSYGAALRRLTLIGPYGRQYDVCLGYETPMDYARFDGCLGATVGRCANRIADASFLLGGERYTLEANEGANTLHSGAAGFHRQIWEIWEELDDSVTFSLASPHLEGGFPGNLEVFTRYTLSEGPILTIDWEATCDRDTILNLTNHSYWNLSGHQSGEILDHLLTIPATQYTPTAPNGIPLGILAPVTGTALDFTQETAIGARINDPSLAAFRGYDHNYRIEGAGLCPAATLTSPKSGISMDIFTTMPAMQLYTANYLAARRGKKGAVYRERHGVCFETQFDPDAIHHPAFPSVLLRAGEQYIHQSIFRFTVPKNG